MDNDYAQHICCEIGYETEAGMPIHSDLCWQDKKSETVLPPSGRVKFSESYRKFIHDNLEEWFEKGGGTGYFYIGVYENVAEALNS
jgi:hypothetical protein